MSRDDRDEERIPRARRRRRRIFRVLVLLAALLVIAAVQSVRVHGEDWVWGWIERATRAQGLEIQVREFEIGLTDLSVEFSDLRLWKPATGSGRFEVAIPYGKIRLPWRYLVGLGRRRAHLAELTLVRPRVVTDGALLDGSKGGSAPTEPISLDILVDRLSVVSGAWRHEDQARKLDLQIENLEIAGDWTRGTRSVLGQIGLSGRLETDPFEEAVELSLDSQFRWRRSTIELIEMRIATPGVEVRADATVDLSSDPVFSGTATVSADLGQVRSTMKPDIPRFDGLAQGAVEFRAGPEPLRLGGQVSVRDAGIDRFSVTSATFQVVYVAGLLTFSEIDATGYGGTVEGQVSVQLDVRPEVRLQLEGKGLDSLELLPLIGGGLPIDSEIDTRLALRGYPSDPESWVASADFDAGGRAGSTTGIPVDAAGTVTIGLGRLTVESENARIEGTRAGVLFEAELDAVPLRGELSLAGETTDAGATQRATMTILDGLGVDYPDLVAQPIEGSGTFSATATFGATQELSLEIDLTQGVIDKQSFEALGLSMELDTDEVRILRMELQGPDVALNGRGRIQLDPVRVLEIELASERLEVAELLELLDIPFELSGQLSGEISARVGAEGLEGAGLLILSDGSCLGQPLEEIRSSVRIVNDRFLLDPLEIRSPVLVARGRGELDQASRRVTFVIDQSVIELGRVEPLGDGLTARIEAVGVLEINEHSMMGHLDLSGSALEVMGVGLDDFNGRIDLDSEGVIARMSSVGSSGWEIEASATLGEESAFEAHARLNKMSVVLPAGEFSDAWAELTGELTATGRPTDLASLELTGRISAGELHWGAHRLDLIHDAEISLSEGQLQLGPLALSGEQTALRIRTSYDLDRNHIDTAVDGSLGLELLSAALPDLRASGTATVELRITGSPGAPDYQGSLTVEGGRLRYLGFPHTLEQIDSLIVFSDQVATIDRFSAFVGGGELEGRGELIVGKRGVESLRLDIDGSNVRVALPKGFVGVYEGRLTLAGTLQQLRLSGEVEMLRGLYNEEFDLGGMLGSSTREYSATSLSGPLASMALDVAVRSDGNVWVRNEVAQVESFFDLRIGGTMRRPEVIGRLGMLEGGTLAFRDTTYRLRTGTLDFTDLDQLNPYIQVNAWTAVGSYEITMRVEGTLDALQYDLVSSPSLPQQDIIALLTTGKTLQELSPDGQRTDAQFTGDLAASYFAGALTERFERQLRQALGLDVFQINPLLINTGDPTTRLTVGKRVNDDVLVILSADLRSTEDRLYQVEWRANRRMLVTVQRDINGGTGSNLLYTDRFWWKKPRADTIEAVPAEVPKEGDSQPIARVIGEVRVEGVDPEEQARIIAVLPLSTGDAYSRSSVFRGVEAIRGYYVRRDRLSARVDSSTSGAENPADPVDVTFALDPGPLITVAFEGLKKKEERRLRSQLEALWTESLFTDDLFSDSVSKIRSDFQHRGFYAVDVRTDAARGDGERRVTFAVDRGKRVHVRTIAIEGANQMPEARVRQQMLTKPPSLFGGGVFKPDTLREDLGAIRNLYTENGYLDIEVESPRLRLSSTGERVDISLKLVEGPQFDVGDVAFTGETMFGDEQLGEWAAVSRGQPFSTKLVLEAEGRVQRQFDDRGYPGIRVDGQLAVQGTEVDLTFVVSPGEKVVASRIDVTGNELTKESVIRRELRIAPGELVSRQKLLGSQQALYRLGIFRNVRIDYRKAPELGPGEYVVEVEVDEEQPLSLTTGVGWNTEAGFKFSLATANDNVQGKARSLGVQGELSGILKQIQLLARTPRIFGAGVPTLGSLLWERADREGFVVQRRSASVRVERTLNDRWRGFLRYSFQNVELLDVTDPAEVAEERIEDIILGSVGFGLLRSTLDSVILPTEGNYLNLNFDLFAKPILSEASFVQTKLTEVHTWTYDNGTTFVTTFRIGIAPPFGQTDLVPISERFFAGGDSTNRGFARDRLGPTAGEISAQDGTPLPPGVPADQPVGGEGLLLFNQDFRVPLIRKYRLKGVVFYDAGNVYFRLRDFDPTDLRHTLGAGLRLETPVGPIRAEYGWKLDRQAGESNGTFHFAIGAIF